MGSPNPLESRERNAPSIFRDPPTVIAGEALDPPRREPHPHPPHPHNRFTRNSGVSHPSQPASTTITRATVASLHTQVSTARARRPVYRDRPALPPAFRREDSQLLSTERVVTDRLPTRFHLHHRWVRCAEPGDSIPPTSTTPPEPAFHSKRRWVLRWCTRVPHRAATTAPQPHHVRTTTAPRPPHDRTTSAPRPNYVRPTTAPRPNHVRTATTHDHTMTSLIRRFRVESTRVHAELYLREHGPIR
jgi:hypothetical protein